MKKTLTSIIAFCVVSSLSAQIVLNSTDFPSIGFSQNMTNDTTIVSQPISKADAGEFVASWDFSASLSTGKNYTSVYMAPIDAPEGSMFTSVSNVALSPADSTGQTYFYNLSSSGLIGVGGVFYVDAVVVPVIFQDPVKVFDFPASMASPTLMDTSIIDMSFPTYSVPGVIDSMRVKQYSTSVSLFNGEGSLTIPSGTFDALRYLKMSNRTDSIWVHALMNVGPFVAGWNFNSVTSSTSSSYEWWTKQTGNTMSILKLEYDGNDVLTSKVWFRDNVVGIAENINNLRVSVYPNPVSDILNIQLSQSDNVTMISIYDMTGREIHKQNLPNLNNQVLVSNLSEGMYFYKVINRNSLITCGKLSIVH